jgi:crotonobetainyl-CoA:carnitine CoA-transferase CaiB-like acyl-CoA transferase
MIGPLPVLSPTPGWGRIAGPGLGEHTQEILASRLGYQRDEIHALHDAGVI